METAGLALALRHILRGIQSGTRLFGDAQDTFSGFDDKIQRILMKARPLDAALQHLGQVDNEGHDDAVQAIVKDCSDALESLEDLIAAAGIDRPSDPASAGRLAKSTWKLNENDIKRLLEQLEECHTNVLLYFKMRRFQSKYYSSESAKVLGGGKGPPTPSSAAPPQSARTSLGHTTIPTATNARSVSSKAQSTGSDTASLVSVEFAFDRTLKSSQVYRDVRNNQSPPTRPLPAPPTAKALGKRPVPVALLAGAANSPTSAAPPSPMSLHTNQVMSRSPLSGDRPISAVLTGSSADESDATTPGPGHTRAASHDDGVEQGPDRAAFRTRAIEQFIEADKEPSLFRYKVKNPLTGDEPADEDGSSGTTETGGRPKTQGDERSDSDAVSWDYASSAESLYYSSVISGQDGAEILSPAVDRAMLRERMHQNLKPPQASGAGRSIGTSSGSEGGARLAPSDDTGVSTSRPPPAPATKRKLLPRWPGKGFGKLKKGKDPKDVPPPTPSPSSPSKAQLTPELPKKTEYQLVALGNLDAGGSALTIKFMQDQFAGGDDTATLRDLRPKPIDIDGQPILLDIVSCSTGDEFSSMTGQCIQTGDGFLLMYSVTSRESFDEIARFQKEILSVNQSKTFSRSQEKMTYKAGQILRPKAMDYFPIVLVGNNCRAPLEEREVEPEVGQELAIAFGCPFVEIDVDDELDTDVPFFQLVREIRRIEEEASRMRHRLVVSTGLPETERPREWLQSPKSDSGASFMGLPGSELQLAKIGLLPRRRGDRNSRS